MKPVIPFLAIVLLATSCTTAYKSGQTPDDVYYSPAQVRSSPDYVQTNREEDRSYRSNRREETYDDGYAYNDDRYLRMKVRNRNRWSDLDYYYSDPYAHMNYNRFYGSNYWSPNSYWNSYSNWNYLYNPYYQPYGHVIVVNPQSPVYSRPRTYNLNTFNRNSVGGYNQPKNSNSRYQTFDDRPYRNSNAAGTGAEMRRSFGSNNSSNSNSSVAPSRSSSPSNSSSSGASSSGSSNSRSAPVRKF